MKGAITKAIDVNEVVISLITLFTTEICISFSADIFSFIYSHSNIFLFYKKIFLVLFTWILSLRFFLRGLLTLVKPFSKSHTGANLEGWSFAKIKLANWLYLCATQTLFMIGLLSYKNKWAKIRENKNGLIFFFSFDKKFSNQMGSSVDFSWLQIFLQKDQRVGLLLFFL